jgi:hypothetical protein
LKIALDGSSPIAGIVVANTNDVTVGTYKLTATDDDIKVKQLYFFNDTGSLGAVSTLTDPRISSLSLYVDGNLVDSRVPSNGVVKFDLGNGFSISKNTNKVITVKASLNPITTVSQTNKIMKWQVGTIVATSNSTSATLDTVL